MTELYIIKQLALLTDKRIYPFMLPNSFIYNWECDFWTMDTKGNTREFEIKISRSDFFNDAKKEKHSNSDAGANYFYYVVPDGLIKPDEVDKRYGLMCVTESGQINIIKKPKRLNNIKFDRWQMLAYKMYWKWHPLS